MRPIETDRGATSSTSESINIVDQDPYKNDDNQDALSESESSSSRNVIDLTFEPTVDMMVNDFDEEATLEEEEALASKEEVDPSIELNELKMESEMPLEALLALYKYTPPTHHRPKSSSRKHRKRRRSAGRETTVQQQQSDEANNCFEEEQPCPAVEEAPRPDPMQFVKDEVIEIEDSIDGEVEGEGDVDGEDATTEQPSEDEEEYPLTRLYPDSFQKSNSSQQLSDEEDDCDYSPDEHEFKKTIMVGGDFQAIIPSGLSQYDDALPYENDDKLLWDPSKIEDTTVEEYLKTTAKITSSLSPNKAPPPPPPASNDSVESSAAFLRDDEQALYLLLQCGHNVDEAVRRKKINSIPPSTHMSIWSEEECRNFESGIRVLGKDFHSIQKLKVKTRCVGELVQFYYLWKKTARHDAFANRTKSEKRKINLCVNATDHMDRFLEEQDGNNTTNSNGNSVGSSTDRSKSPLSSSSSSSASPTFETNTYSSNSSSLLLPRRCSNGIAANNNFYLGNSPLKKMKQRSSVDSNDRHSNSTSSNRSPSPNTTPLNLL